MSVMYQPVQWNRNKYVYDAWLVAGIVLYVLAFLRLAPMLPGGLPPVDAATLRMRAFGTCAFVMLTLILCIGPAARLDRRFLPLLYNRRHFGVMLFFVAVTHVSFVLGWYFSFSPTPTWVALLSSSTSFGSFVGFPIVPLGLAALIILFAMAATSHDFWLAFLGPPVWKALHMGVYLAYGLVVMHVTLGLLQSGRSPVYAIAVGVSVALVTTLHVAAGLRERRRDQEGAAIESVEGTSWVVAGKVDEVPVDRAIVVPLPGGERVAVVRHGDRLSALSNVCAHQNGPLGEGHVIDGCVTCPWHGFQYRPEDGCAPPPFTEKVPTYRLRLDGDRILVDPRALPPGTPVPPIELAGARS